MVTPSRTVRCLLVPVLWLALVAGGSQHAEVTIVKSGYNATGFRRAETDEALQALYTANLEPDLAHWRQLREQRGRRFAVAELVQQLQRVQAVSPYVGVLLVRDGRVFTFQSRGGFKFAHVRLQKLGQALQELNASGIAIPNTFMLVNTEDEPICQRVQGCKVPVFAFFKRWHPPRLPLAAAAAAPEQDAEVLLPSFTRSWDHLFMVPWEHKNNTAFHRAVLQRSMNESSTRYKLAALSTRDNATAQILDVGLVLNSKRVPEQLRKSYVSMPKHAYWRFLINTDGHTASSRLGHLLGINSVVLKEDSPWVEYYYRSLAEGKEFVGFNVDNVLQVIQDLRAPEQSAKAQQIATSGQQFAYAYLHAKAKALYLRQAITRYNELIKGLGFLDKLHFLQLSRQPHLQLQELIGRIGALKELE